MIREVTEVVETNLKDLKQLKTQIASANLEVNRILKQSKVLAQDLEQEAAEFRQDLGGKRTSLSKSLTDFAQIQQKSMESFQELQHSISGNAVPI